MSLRWLLVVIGVVIIAIVYLVTSAKRRRDARVSFDRRFSSLDVPDVILHHEDEEADNSNVAPPAIPQPRSRPAPATNPSPLPESVMLPPEDINPADLPQVRNTLDDHAEPGNERRRSDQLDMFGAASEKPAASATPAEPESPVTPDDGLIKLFVRARSERPFRGPDVVRTFNTVGLTYGDMAIFHHYGSGELRCDSAIFSAANMFEPGTFEMSRIEAFETTGIVLFMQLPTPLDGPVAFELLLNTAQRLTELLDGELYAGPRSRLDPRNIAEFRNRAARFSDGHT